MSIHKVIHKNIEPCVINNALLLKNILAQGPSGESGRLFASDGIVFEEVLKLRLEFLNILKIDHLWMFTSLTKLQLCNNIIEKIENIEMLVHLTELDMSFNYITQIENLEMLGNSETLLLYQNRIMKIDNLTALTKLTILSLGNNIIEDWDENILYLRKFPTLRSLNLAGNPCSALPDFRLFLAVFLPQLKYYEYRLLRPSELEEGMQIYELKLEKLEQDEMRRKEIDDRIAAEEADIITYSVSYIEYLSGDQFFDSLFAKDPEGQAFLKMGEEITAAYMELVQKQLVI